MKRQDIVNQMNTLFEALSQEYIRDLVDPKKMLARAQSNLRKYSRELGKNGPYTVMGDSEGAIVLVKKGKVVATGDYDRGANAFFINLPGSKHNSFDTAIEIAQEAERLRV